MTLRIGSRGSALALWQAEHVKARLLAVDPTLHIEITIVQTTGDRVTDVPLARIGDKGLFTKELDVAVLEGTADLAVHSLKDVPTRVAEGLELAAILERADVRDALVVAPGRERALESLPRGGKVGTSSLRRRAQLAAARPDLVVEDLRGNVDTRLRRVAEGHYDAAILAAAGLQRLGFDDRIAQLLDPPAWLPAVGQGALCVTTRLNDERTSRIVHKLDHAPTRAAITAERALLARLEGGCQIPIGALATVGKELALHALVASVDGTHVVRASASGTLDPQQLGEQVAQELLRGGADRILAELRDQPSPAPAAP